MTAGDVDRSWRARTQHLDALFRGFDDLCARLERVEGPVQCFLTIAPEQSRSDALHVNTPNPHDVFPLRLESVSWGTQPPAALRPWLAGRHCEFGRSDRPDGTQFYVRSKGRLSRLEFADVPPAPLESFTAPLVPRAVTQPAVPRPAVTRPAR